MDRRQVLMLFVIGIGIALNVHLVGAIDDNVTSNRNPKHYNIGAILSDNQYIVSFINVSYYFRILPFVYSIFVYNRKSTKAIRFYRKVSC